MEGEAGCPEAERICRKLQPSFEYRAFHLRGPVAAVIGLLENEARRAH